VSIKEWLAFQEKRVVALFVPEEPPPPPPPGPKGQPAPRPKPFVPKEPPLSMRRLLIGLEAAVLAAAVWQAVGSWRMMLGGWPSRANVFPPVVRAFEGVASIDVAAGNLWVAGVQGLTLVRLGSRPPSFTDLGNALPSPVVTAIAAGAQETLIGTTRGLITHDGRRMHRVAGGTGAGSADVRALARDGSGRVWVGTAQGGLLLRDGETWKSFVDELSSPYVTALAPAGARTVWVGLYAGGVLRTDGETWERMAPPARQKGKPVRRIAPLGQGSALVLTDGGLDRVGPAGWRPWSLRYGGIAEGDRILDLAVLPEGGFALLYRSGVLLSVSRKLDDPRPLAPGLRVTAIGAKEDALYFAADGVVYRANGGITVPLTDWAEFFDPASFMAPGADIPGTWTDPRFKRLGGRFAFVALLAAAALLIRSFRWRLSAERYHWRIAPDRQLAAGCAALGALYLAQWLGWIATGADRVLLLPIAAVAGLWVAIHGVRILARDPADTVDPFWIGVALTIAGTTAWLWWMHAALIPAIWCATFGALFFSRSVQGIRSGLWSGFRLAWGGAVILLQLAAYGPPLVFAGMTWGKAAFSMMPTSPLAQGLPVAPERFAWSEDGEHAAYIVQRNGATQLQLINASTTAWVPVSAPVESLQAVPQFSPDGRTVALLTRRGADTQVELIGMDGRRTWSSRLSGVPAPGLQPCWFRSGTSMMVLTYVKAGTQVWRVGREHGDAVRLMTVPDHLSWPSLSEDGLRFAAAATAAPGEMEAVGEGSSTPVEAAWRMPGMAIVWLAGQRVVKLDPHADAREPLLLYDPSIEGQAVLNFIDRVRDGARTRLARVRATTQRLVRIFGWSVQVPELWIRKAWKPPRPIAKDFRWADYDAVRDVVLSADGRTIACVARRGDGRDLLLYMGSDGDHLRTLYQSRGMLYDLHWAPYKNRIMVVEQTQSVLAPFPTHRLMVINGLPEKAEVEVVVPFTPCVYSPQFSPDGQRLAYAAPDRFWRPFIHPEATFGIFEIALESEIGVLGPPPPPAAASKE